MAYRVKYWTGAGWAELGEFGLIKMSTGSGTGNWRFIDLKVAGSSGSAQWDIPVTLRDTQTVTVGTTTISDKFGSTTYYGYGSGFGSISDGSSNVLGGASITALQTVNSIILEFTVSGNLENTGWSALKIDSTYFRRDEASFTSGGGSTTWSWASGGDILGTSGTKAVYFY